MTALASLPSGPVIDSASGFASLSLPAAMLENLSQLGYSAMTPVQAACLPTALQGKDLIVQAQTGSGKTAAFALALLARLDAAQFAVQALVLCPTRELADQVSSEIRRIARATSNIKVLTLCGGVALRGQTASLAHGAHIAVGTPGRIMDHLARGHLPLEALNTLVLDEADRMLDMGFLDDIAVVAKACPANRQTLLFSATYPPGIESISQRFMRQPQRITVAVAKAGSGKAASATSQASAANATAGSVGNIHSNNSGDASIGNPAGSAQGSIVQRWYQVPHSAKDIARLDAVAALLRHHRPASTLAFCNTKAQCRALTERLQSQGFSALALFGELEQKERDQVLIQFANGSCSVLVATDVAARGLDIADLAMVVNVDVTPQPELHIHRIGRTGRAGADGLAISLASLDEMGAVGSIEQLQKQESAWHPLAELLPASTAPLLPAMVTLHITGGRKEKIRAGDVLGALTAEAGPGEQLLTREHIGKINVNEFSTYVAVDRQVAQVALQRLAMGKVKGKNVKVRLLAG